MKYNRGASSVSGNFTPRPKNLGALRKRHPEKWVGRLENYFWSNLISVITAVGSLIGGLLILIYLESEHYFPPNMTFSSIGMLLAAAAVTGIFITLLLGLYLIFPGVSYRHILNADAGISSVELFSDSSIFWLLDVPSIFLLSVLTLLLYWPNNWLMILLIAGAYFSILLVYPLPKYLNLLKWKWGLVIQCILSVIPWFFVLLIVANYDRAAHGGVDSLLIFFDACMVVIFANHLIAGAKKWWIILVVLTVILFVISVATQQFSLIPHVVARMVALGDIQNVTLLLDEQGCKIASQYAFSPSTEAAKTTSNKVEENKATDEDATKAEQQETTTCSISPVRLMWRIGDEYFIEANQSRLYVPLIERANEKEEDAVATDDIRKQRKRIDFGAGKRSSNLPMRASKFTIPSSHVLSWSVTEQKKSVGQ